MDIYNASEANMKDYKKKIGKLIGKNLRSIRIKKSLTQEDVAGIAEINTKYLGEIERGEKNPTTIVIHSLSEALNVPVCEIFSTKNCAYENKITS